MIGQRGLPVFLPGFGRCADHSSSRRTSWSGWSRGCVHLSAVQTEATQSAGIVPALYRPMATDRDRFRANNSGMSGEARTKATESVSRVLKGHRHSCRNETRAWAYPEDGHQRDDPQARPAARYPKAQGTGMRSSDLRVGETISSGWGPSVCLPMRERKEEGGGRRSTKSRGSEGLGPRA